MAPPSPFTTKYDADIKRHIIEVRDKTTGDVKKFVYNDNSNNFEGAVEPVVVYERDLEPVYATACARHNKIVFCRSKWSNGEVYKYRQGDERGPWQKVQCLCCHYDKNQQVDEKSLKVIKDSMTPDRVVDDSKYSYLWIQPVFSKFCEKTQKITVFASVYPNQDHLLAWNFDLKKQNFVPSECRDFCCQQIPEWNRCAARPFDFGSQGLHYARHHRDQAGNPLICLAITWYNTEHGVMETFLDKDGDIGRYTWNENCKCFDLVQTLDVKTLNHNVPEGIVSMKPDLWYDDGFRFLSTKLCPTLMEKIFFCYHAKDGKYRKFIFNAITLQFVYVQCPCCIYRNHPQQQSTEEGTIVATYTSNSTGTNVSIVCTKNNGIQKELYTHQGEKVILERSPIRIDAHLQPYEFIPRRQIEHKKESMVQMLIDSHIEGWLIRQFRVSTDNTTSIGTVALMDGSVKPFYYAVNTRNYRIYEPDCVKPIIHTLSERLNDVRYALDWDLSPKTVSNCKHSGDQLITAYNHFTHSMGNYHYDSETGHCYENEGCVECQKDFHPVGANQVIMGGASPYSSKGVILKTNDEGRLMRMGHNPANQQYCGMAPLRILQKPDQVEFEFKHQITSQEHLKMVSSYLKMMEKYQKLVDSLEQELKAEKDAVAKLEKEVENMMKSWDNCQETMLMLNETVDSLLAEKEKMEKKKEEAKKKKEEMFPDNALHKMSTDFDLIPKYRNYCSHTGHFYLTAYNVLSETTGHFVFNPTTTAFHPQEYCSKCPRYEKGVKIQSFVTIMPVKTPKSEYPYLIMTNHHGRLVKIAFDVNIKGFISLEPTEIAKSSMTLDQIPNSVGNRIAIPMPTTLTGPFDSDLIPKFRVFCTHVGDFLINAFNNAIGQQGFYIFNSRTGHLEQHAGCETCRNTSPMYHIEPLRSIMPVMTPYSKWPLMLTTDKDGKFLPIAFQPDTHKFECMNQLAIRMMNPPNVFRFNPLPQARIDEEEVARSVKCARTIPVDELVQLTKVAKDMEELEEKEAEPKEVETKEAEPEEEEPKEAEPKLSTVDRLLQELAEKPDDSDDETYEDEEDYEDEDEEEDEEEEEEVSDGSERSEGSDGSEDEYCDCSGSECENCMSDVDEEESEDGEESEGSDDDDDEYCCDCSGDECECSDYSDEEEEEEKEGEESSSKIPSTDYLPSDGSFLDTMNALFTLDVISAAGRPEALKRLHAEYKPRSVPTFSIEERMKKISSYLRPNDYSELMSIESMDDLMQKVHAIHLRESTSKEGEEDSQMGSSTMTAVEPEKGMVASTVTAIEGETSDSDLSLIEEKEMVSSTLTAVEPEETAIYGESSDSDLSLVDDKEMVSSTMTAIEPEAVVAQEMVSSTATAIEGADGESSDSDLSFIEDEEMVSSTITAIEPEKEMIASTATAIEEESSVSDIDDEEEIAIEAPKVQRAGPPSEEYKEMLRRIEARNKLIINFNLEKTLEQCRTSYTPNYESFVKGAASRSQEGSDSDSDLSLIDEKEMVSSTTTAIEPEEIVKKDEKVISDDASSLSSDISYLNSDLGSVNGDSDSDSSKIVAESTSTECGEPSADAPDGSYADSERCTIA